MKTRLLLTLASILVAGAVGLSGVAIAQGNGGGGGGGGGKGGGGGGSPSPPDYGDLIILYRDANGAPIPDGALCQQPIAFTENVGCPADDLIWNALDEVWLVPTDPATCAIEPQYATCVEEADFGRVNLSRASERVLASQLQDVLVNLAIADCTSLDPAGRLVYSRYVGGDLVTGTVDSPLQNLAIYKFLMLDGELGVPLPQSAGVLETAARGFGVAMDKAGLVNIDLLVYLNQIMGLTDPAVDTYLDKVSVTVREEVMGNVVEVTKWFLDYSGFAYDRTANFTGLPSPAYIPEGAPTAGFFEFLADMGGGTYIVTNGPIESTVFLGEPPFAAGNIAGFSRAADDTRAVIKFMHTYAVPDADRTPVPCDPIPNPTAQYDLSISEKSGLKVPKQVVATTEGREFVVTVANAGPDTAAGTLTVTANTAEGGDVLVDGLPGPFVFEFDGLVPGLTYSTGTMHFTIGEPHVATKITWTAVVEADDVDPNMGNNAVTATSNVRMTGGGGH
jgi:hypothetical protein